MTFVQSLASLCATASCVAVAVPAWAQGEPLGPSGKWVIEYHKDMCVGSRAFGTGKDEFVLAIRPIALNPAIEIALLTRDGERTFGADGAVRIERGSGTAPIESTYFSRGKLASGQRVATLTINREQLASIGVAQTLRFAFAGKRAVAIVPTGIAGMLNALETCQTDLAKSWGVSPDDVAKVAVTAGAIGDEAAWFSSESYPPEAVRTGAQGTATILWQITAEGRVGQCFVVSSSGHPLLDKASCQGVVTRGRYTPATGRGGQPVPSWRTRRVAWVSG